MHLLTKFNLTTIKSFIIQIAYRLGSLWHIKSSTIINILVLLLTRILMLMDLFTMRPKLTESMADFSLFAELDLFLPLYKHQTKGDLIFKKL